MPLATTCGMKSLLIFLYFMGLGTVASAQNLCSDVNLRSSKIEASMVDLDLFQFGYESNLIIIGEKHYLTDPSLLQNILVQASKTMGKNACLFVEFSSDVGPNEMISTVKEGLASLPPGPSDDRANMTKILQYFEPLVSKANELGMKSYSVDHPENFGQGMDINIRDEAMSNRIQELLANGSCSSAVFFVGKAHITADEIGRTTLKQKLTQAKVRFSTFIAQHASDPGHEKLASWNRLCSSQRLPNPQSPVVFSSAVFDPQTPIWPKMIGGSWTGGLWQDFDYVILAK